MFVRPGRIEQLLSESHDLTLLYLYELKKARSTNPLAKYGYKCFSQADEDGITMEIALRLGLSSKGTFCEFGVGDGTENNTLILLAAGWRGAWVGNDQLKFNEQADGSRLKYTKTWVTKENIVSIAKTNLEKLEATEYDLVSLDFDGNDLHLVEQLLQNGIQPSVFIVEYNAHFPPPIQFCVTYNPKHLYKGDDYFGASLQTFFDMFSTHGYTLVCCNLMTGANAFFIRNDCMTKFGDVPQDISKIYAPPSYYLLAQYGYKRSCKTISALI
jgi:hypothetical protein